MVNILLADRQSGRLCGQRYLIISNAIAVTVSVAGSVQNSLKTNASPRVVPTFGGQDQTFFLSAHVTDARHYDNYVLVVL